MKIEERSKLATEGLVVAAVSVDRRPTADSKASSGGESDADSPFHFSRMQGTVKLSSRALWLGNGRLIPQLHAVRPSLAFGWHKSDLLSWVLPAAFYNAGADEIRRSIKHLEIEAIAHSASDSCLLFFV